MKRIACAGVLAAMLLAACSPKTPEQQKPAPSADGAVSSATSKQVMLGLTIPASEVMWQVGAKVPANDADWERVTANAVMLAESGLLLMSAPRDPKQAEWTQFATDLVTHARAAADAAQKHDVDALLAAGDEVYQACDSCHNKFMPAKVAEQAAK
ncbi:MAG: hypothetical protein RL030_1929 [Pseudomonadota bacterium]|jgi:hypothetical protein